MHGLIFGELKQYVTARLGPNAWNDLLTQAGIGPKLYLAVEEYPDSEVVAIVTTASRITGLEPAALLQDFGEFIGPQLVKMYRAYVKPEWRALDVIEHTEERIHRMVRLHHNGARPPYLTSERRSEKAIVIHYNSERKLCSLAKGIALGIGKHYGENMTVRDLACMHKGDARCELLVEV
ncbi:MAG: heme NO-binding domain-containing protein, partial [Acidobacteriota bacterium]|nr:heme NO-binding domain-containing protein [Acidobacteriota bacterium]